MSKKQVVDAIATATGIQKSTIREVLGALKDVAKSELTSGKRFVLPGIAIMSLRLRKARKGRNARTGVTVDIPEKVVVKIKPVAEISAVAESASL